MDFIIPLNLFLQKITKSTHPLEMVLNRIYILNDVFLSKSHIGDRIYI